MFGIFASLIGAAVSARAQRAQGDAAMRQAEYNAQLQRNKAQSIAYARRAETSRMTASARRVKASQRAQYSKTGAVITGDTPLFVMLEQAGDMQQDIMNQRRNRMIQEQQAEAGADMTEYEGQMARQAAYQAASNTLLSGALKVGTSLFTPDFNFGGDIGGSSIDTGLYGTPVEGFVGPIFEPYNT